MFVVSHSSLLNKIRISVNYTDIEFQIIPDSDILTHPEWFPDVNVNSLQSVNKILQNYNVATYDFNTSYYSGFIDLQRVKSFYLHCNEISNYNQLTVAGNSSIIKKINVSVPHLGVINDNELSSFDYINVSGKTLRRLNFRLTNHLNEIVELNGVDISFAITFFRG